MPDSFVPKDFLVAPSLFGRPQASWKPWEPEGELLVAKAWLQHCFVERVVVAIEEDTDGIEAFALQVSAAVRTVKDKLCGRQPIVVDDLVAWPMVLGVDKYPRIEQRSRFLPPTELVRTDFEADVLPIARPKAGA